LLKACFHVSVTVLRYRHRRDKITARSSIFTPLSPLAVRISDPDGDGAANVVQTVETGAIFKLGSEWYDFRMFVAAKLSWNNALGVNRFSKC